MSARNERKVSIVLAKSEKSLETLAQEYFVLVLGVLVVSERVEHLEFDVEKIRCREKSEIQLAAAVGVH